MFQSANESKHACMYKTVNEINNNNFSKYTTFNDQENHQLLLQTPKKLFTIMPVLSFGWLG